MIRQGIATTFQSTREVALETAIKLGGHYQSVKMDGPEHLIYTAKLIEEYLDEGVESEDY